MIRSEKLLVCAACLATVLADRGEKDAAQDAQAIEGVHPDSNRVAASSQGGRRLPSSRDSNLHVQIRPSGLAALHQEVSPLHKRHGINHAKHKSRRPDVESGQSSNELQAAGAAQASSSNAAAPNETGKVDEPAIRDEAGRSSESSHADGTTLSPLVGAQREIESLGGGTMQEKLKKEEHRLQQAEGVALESGLHALAKAVEEPRRFLLSLPGMNAFVTGLRAAVELQGNNKCLKDGDFAGFGCLTNGRSPSICQCGGVLQSCWAENDEDRIVRTFSDGNRASALVEAKSLLFGQCYTPVWLVPALVGGAIIVAVIVFLVAIYFQNLRKVGGAFAMPDLLSSFMDKVVEKIPKSVRFADDASERSAT